ncbi:N-formylglutamate amidohydrolase [Nocardia yamanashiensis]|uniref:N-formylglutamate amidohydrolase n=1 Tax=Nocardia yamanashiensis TaxID=209247 RepID=UPI00082E02B3|nr:N-formylglutamate amidohydrolase [Nocardia yamanashiensis]
MPDSFERVPGHPDSPIILHVPHSSRVIPPEVRSGILLDDAALELELDHITDAHTEHLAAATADRMRIRPWQFVNRRSRLVVDPERFPDDREEMLTVGMGAVYTRTTHRTPLRAVEFDPNPLLDTYFHPYARAMTDLVADRLAATGSAVILDVHSYPSRSLPYELHADGPRPPICLGTDDFHTPPALLDRARACLGVIGETATDAPFAGTYVPLDYYVTDPRVTALMIEIRRDVYMTEPGGPPTSGFSEVSRALAAFADELA